MFVSVVHTDWSAFLVLKDTGRNKTNINIF